MCSSDVRFTVECLSDVIFEFWTLKMTLKTHSTQKRRSKLDCTSKTQVYSTPNPANPQSLSVSPKTNLV
jgi:hypothetical protein